MAETYFILVINQRRTCDETNKETKLVPVTYRVEVSKMLDERGYNLNGLPVV